MLRAEPGSIWRSGPHGGRDNFHAFCCAAGRTCDLAGRYQRRRLRHWFTHHRIREYRIFGDHPYPFINDQFHYVAQLIVWLASEHEDIVLGPTDTGLNDPGDPASPGITCHKFIQLVWRAKPENQSKAFTPKACPGTGIIDQFGDLPAKPTSCQRCVHLSRRQHHPTSPAGSSSEVIYQKNEYANPLPLAPLAYWLGEISS